MARSELRPEVLEPRLTVDPRAAADPAWLAGRLGDAPPEAIAAALTALSPGGAAAVLGLLPGGLRDAVARRLGLAAFQREADGRRHRGPLFALAVYVDAFGLDAGSALFASVHEGALDRRPTGAP